MPPRRHRAQHPCVVCAQFLRPGTCEEPDVSCDGCSARIGHELAPVAHIACILPGGTDDDDDEKKGMILDQDGDGVTTWLCQRCRRRTMDPEGAPAPAPAAAEPPPLAPAPAAAAPPPPPPPLPVGRAGRRGRVVTPGLHMSDYPGAHGRPARLRRRPQLRTRRD